MPPHVDILDEPETLRRPLLGSIALHGAVFAILALTTFLHFRHQPWGSANPGGGTIGINVVHGIPMPSRAGLTNPLANDTHSQIPAPPPKPKEQKKVVKPSPKAIPIKGRTVPRRQSEIASSRTPYRAQKEESSNQLYSASGQALVSPLIGQTGGGGVGVGRGALGNRFGWYVALLKDKVARNWRTGDLDPRLQTAPPVIVTFTIVSDGTVRDVRVTQRSGNSTLDYSAERAIYDSSPFPPLPPGAGSDANIEFWFQLRR